MNLQTQSLKLTFFFALIPTICFPTLFPTLHLIYLAPYLVTLYYQRPYINCLWGSFLCGLLLDLLSQHHKLGLFAANFCLTTVILFPFRRNFFADTLTTLPIMTYFFSLIASLLQAVMMIGFGQTLQISFSWILTDVVLYPFLDATYAFGFFTLPFWILGKPQRKGKDYFLSRR